MTRTWRCNPHILTAALAFVLVVTAGCTNPFGLAEGSDAHGRLVLSMHSGTTDAARFTIFPDLQATDIASYEIALAGGPGADVFLTVEADAGAFPAPLEIRDIIPGTWTVTVTGYDGADPESARAVVRGSEAGVDIRAGESTNVDSIVLTYLDDDGHGFFDFTIIWPADEPVDRAVFVLEALDGRVESIDATDDDALEVNAAAGTATKSVEVSSLQTDDDNRYAATFLENDTSLAAGWYWITVRFDREAGDDNPGASTWVVDELVLIRPNVTSSAVLHIDDIPLEVRIANEVEDSISATIEDDDDFDSDELGFTYTGTGGGSITIDTSGIAHTVDISFKIRNDSVGRNNVATDDAAGRFSEGTNVAVLFDENTEPEQTYYPPYPWRDDNVGSVEDTELIPADDEEAGAGYNGPTLEELNSVIDGDPQLEGVVVLDGDYKGFLQVTFRLPDPVDLVTFTFGGGANRDYSFGDFEASLVDEE